MKPGSADPRGSARPIQRIQGIYIYGLNLNPEASVSKSYSIYGVSDQSRYKYWVFGLSVLSIWISGVLHHEWAHVSGMSSVRSARDPNQGLLSTLVEPEQPGPGTWELTKTGRPKNRH